MTAKSAVEICEILEKSHRLQAVKNKEFFAK